MGLFTKDIKTMNDLFVHQLQDIYYAENQLVKALPTMAQKATDPQLKQGFLTHLEETRQHVKRLEEVFKMHGAEVKGADCPAIDGIIEEANDVAGDISDKEVLDAALIAAAQAVEHYEIARYGALAAILALCAPASAQPFVTGVSNDFSNETSAARELPQVKEHLARFGDQLPAEIRGQLESLEQRLG